MTMRSKDSARIGDSRMGLFSSSTPLSCSLSEESLMASCQKYQANLRVVFFFFWLHLQHVEVPKPGIESMPEQ